METNELFHKESMYRLFNALQAVEAERLLGAAGYTVDEVTAMMRTAIQETMHKDKTSF